MEKQTKGKCGKCEKELDDIDQTLCDECDDKMREEEQAFHESGGWL